MLFAGGGRSRTRFRLHRLHQRLDGNDRCGDGPREGNPKAEQGHIDIHLDRESPAGAPASASQHEDEEQQCAQAGASRECERHPRFFLCRHAVPDPDSDSRQGGKHCHLPIPATVKCRDRGTTLRHPLEQIGSRAFHLYLDRHDTEDHRTEERDRQSGQVDLMVGFELLEGLHARGDVFFRLPHGPSCQFARGFLLTFGLLSIAACGGWVLVRIWIVIHKE